MLRVKVFFVDSTEATFVVKPELWLEIKAAFKDAMMQSPVCGTVDFGDWVVYSWAFITGLDAEPMPANG